MTGLNVKTEIPQQETGRLVSALTDMIRPFTEARGLKGDQIRLQREDVLIDIAKKALSRAQLENSVLNPVPSKMLVPLLEKASLEDADKDMQDRWAALLLSASKQYQARHLTFVDIMSRLSSEELKLLEDTCLSYESFPRTTYPTSHFEDNRIKIKSKANILVSSGSSSEIAQIAYDQFIKETKLIYGQVMYASVRRPEGGCYFFYQCSPGHPQFSSLELLQKERLVEFERLASLAPTHFDAAVSNVYSVRDTGIEVGYFNVTNLGISFVSECSPTASRMKKK